MRARLILFTALGFFSVLAAETVQANNLMGDILSTSTRRFFDHPEEEWKRPMYLPPTYTSDLYDSPNAFDSPRLHHTAEKLDVVLINNLLTRTQTLQTEIYFVLSLKIFNAAGLKISARSNFYSDYTEYPDQLKQILRKSLELSGIEIVDANTEADRAEFTVDIKNASQYEKWLTALARVLTTASGEDGIQALAGMCRPL